MRMRILSAATHRQQRNVQVLKETYGYLYVHVHPFSQMNIKQTKEFFSRLTTTHANVLLQTAIMKYALALLYMTLFILFSVNF